MSTRTTPAKTVRICDICGDETEGAHYNLASLTIESAARDFQGGIVAGNTHRRDMCDTCSTAMIAAINETAARLNKRT